MENTLTLRGLTKRYGDLTALDRVDVTFTPGVYGILGANGAGKSTMMNLIAGNIRRTGGEILFDGTDILQLGRKFRKMLGYMPQQQGFYESMTADTFLYYMAEVKAVPKRLARAQIGEILSTLHLSEVRHKRLSGFSGGMRQRVLLAQALLGDPAVVILDEPTAGLDPQERIRTREYIAELARDRIVLLATHVVADVETVAAKVLLMKEGRIAAMDSPAALMEKVAPHVTEPVTGRLGLEDVYLYYLGDRQ